MRTISTIGVSSSMQTAEASTLPPSPLAAVAGAQKSPWHSPVPYLFGGLAAMLGLIAFALLILACSYWRLSGQMDDRDHQDDHYERGLESGSGAGAGQSDSGNGVKVYEEKILVIMAGDEKPTYLATPVCAKVSSFGEKTENRKGENNEEKENPEKVKEVIMIISDDHHDDDRANNMNTTEDVTENQLEAQNQNQ